VDFSFYANDVFKIEILGSRVIDAHPPHE